MNDLPKRKIERYRELVSELGQHLTAKQWKKAHSRLARTTLLFQRAVCATSALSPLDALVTLLPHPQQHLSSDMVTPI